jgi:hypothetical protein
MSDLQFLLGGEVFRVRGLVARLACDRLAEGRRAERLEVNSAASAEVFQLFRSAVEGEVIEITNANIDGLSTVCDKFGFEGLSERLRAVKGGPAHQQKVRVDAFEERVRRLEADVQAVQGSHQMAAAQAGVTAVLDSAIISDFPEILNELPGKCLSPLWRGSRDGFRARNFHSRCDGHANTLTVILDTDGNIFGGFSPLEWGHGRSIRV